MMTQKRDPAYRAYKKDIKMELMEDQMIIAHITVHRYAKNWLNGWNDGREDQVTGFPEHLELMH